MRHLTRLFSSSGAALSKPEFLKKLKYLSFKRGMLENELIFERFWSKHGQNLSASELSDFEMFLNEYDDDIFAWLTGKKEAPEPYSSSKLFKSLQDTVKDNKNSA
jgi:succinate dehydrogenase flavin-adding protein (antitoxin of CptAB toxin-antitoxin module)